MIRSRKKTLAIFGFKGIDRRVGALTSPESILRTAEFVDLSGTKMQPMPGWAQTNISKETNAPSRAFFKSVYADQNAVLFSNASDIRYYLGPRPLWTDYDTETLTQSGTTQLLAYGDTHRTSVAAFRKQIYVCNGWNKSKVWNGVKAVSDVGIASPASAFVASTATGGSVTLGDHLVRYRYKDTATGYVSEASNIDTASAVSGSQRVKAPVKASTDAKVDRIVVEMTEASGTFFYQSATTANSTVTVTISDSDDTISIPANIPSWPDDQGISLHGVPPVKAYQFSHRDRIWVAGTIIHDTGTASVVSGSTAVTFQSAGITSDNSTVLADNYYLRIGTGTTDYRIVSTGTNTAVISPAYASSTATRQSYKIFAKGAEIMRWSLAGYVESFPTGNEIEVLQDKADRFVAAFAHGSDIIISGRHSMERFGYNTDPLTDGQMYPIQGDRGLLNSACFVVADDLQIFGMDRLGMWMFTGSVPIDISGPIRDFLPNMKWEYDTLFHTSYHAKSRSVRFWVVYTGYTTTKTFFEYFIDTETWAGPITMPMAVVASCQAIDSNGGQFTILIDERGYIWADGYRGTIGVFPSTSSVVAVASAVSTTRLNVTLEGGGTAAMKSDGAKLAGVPVHNRTKDEWTYANGAAAQTATVLTLGAAFTTTPATGDVLLLGPVEMKIKTKPIVLGNIFNLQQAVALHVYFEPTSTQQFLYVRFFKDRSATAFSDWNTLTTGDGAVFTASTAYVKVDMSEATGKAAIPIGPLNFWRTMEIELSVRDSNVLPKIEGIEFEGYEIEEISQ